MSVIYGIVMFNGQPVNQQVLDNMKSAMEFWGPDDKGSWKEGSAGLGNLLLYNTPEAVFEKMPFSDSTGNLIFTASARIDNRTELCRLFRITPQEAMKLPDSYFIMKAYERWGEDCPDHLLGDWSFAVWDKTREKLFIARDHHGITALYYYKGKDFFVFSSSLKGILCFKEIEKKVNEYKVSQILVGWNEGGPETCYQDIFRLPPAHTLSLEKEKVTTNRYWFLEHTPELRLPEEQQYLDLFLDIYTEAVKCRLRSYKPVGATLSGGLDSGSVCALASRELKKEGKRLPAFTSVPLYDTTGLVPPNRIGDEGPLAQAVADHCGNIDITFCKAENISPIEGVERMLEIHDEPIHAAANAYWMIDIMEKAKEQGIGTLLIGQGGNFTINYKTAKRDLKSIIRRIFNFLFFKKYYNQNMYFVGFKSRLLQLKFAFYNQIVKLNYRTWRKVIFKYFTNDLGLVWRNVSQLFKSPICDPTFDSRIITFCFSLSQNKFFQDKRLLKTSLHNILPSSIVYNLKRGIQASDLLIRMNKENNSILKNPRLFLREELIVKFIKKLQ